MRLSMNSGRIKLILRVIVSIVLLSYLVSMLDWQVVMQLKPEIAFVVILGAAIFMATQCLMSLRWKLILDCELHDSVAYLSLLRYYTVAQFFNILLPGSVGGDAVRATSASRKYNIDIKRSLAVVVSERFFGLAALTFIISLGFVINPVLLKKVGFFHEAGFILLVLAVVGFFVARYLATKNVKLSLPMAVWMLVISGIAQLADILITFLFSQYFGLDILFSDLLFVIPLVYIATIIPISIGGLGVREGVMVFLLGSFGVDQSVAIIIALAIYLTKVIVGLLGGIFYLRGEEVD